INRNSVSATLNQKTITARFASNLFRPGELTATVAAADGLLPGRNQFSVEVRGPGVRPANDAITFTVTANQPRANAGADARHLRNRTIRLDGSRSTGSNPANAATLIHKWALVSKPSRSNANLSNPNSPTPEFTADKAGAYVFRLTVAEPGGGFESEPDTVTIEVRSDLALHKVDTRVICSGCDGSDASHYAIVVDGVSYPGPKGGPPFGVNIVTLRRDTLAPINQFTSLDGQETANYLDAVLNPATTPDAIVIISTIGKDTRFGAQPIASRLVKLGATHEFDNIGLSDDFVFSFIGATGLDGTNQGYQVGGASNLSGYFAQDSQKKYTFAQFDFVGFELTPSRDASGGTIKIGNDPASLSYQPTVPAGAAGGFHVVVVDRANPTATPKFNNTYATNGANGNDQLDAMNAFLAGFITDETSLVFVNSFGKPIAAQNQSSRRVGQKLHMIGGTYELFTYLSFLNPGAADSYAFVGTASPPGGSGPPLYQGPEASTMLGQTGILKGTLGRGTRGQWYAPIASARTANTDFGLYRILALPAGAYPAPTTPSQQAAMESIGNELCDCADVRAGYIDTNAPISIWYAQLEGTEYADLTNQTGFTEADYKIVRAQVLKELKYVDAIRRFQENLATLWTDQQANFSLLVGSVTAKINDSLKPPQESITQSIFKELESALIEKAEEIVAEEIKIPLGIVQAAVKIASNLAKSPEGPSATELVATKVGELDEQAAYGFAQQLSALGTMFDVVLEDWPKIEALGKALNNPTDPNWSWNGSQPTGQLLNAMTPGIEASIYQSILASVYTVREMNLNFKVTGGRLDPGGYCYDYLGTGCNRHFEMWPDGAWYRSLVWNEFPDDNDISQPDASIPLLTRISPDNGKPATDLIAKLTGPVSAGGLNIWPPFILRRWPALPRNYCDQNYTNRGKCNQPAATNCEQLGPSGLGNPGCLDK
ncbi:MAG: PKD domain-containing protein, partial [Blastocatellia bacterium]